MLSWYKLTNIQLHTHDVVTIAQVDNISTVITLLFSYKVVTMLPYTSVLDTDSWFFPSTA